MRLQLTLRRPDGSSTDLEVTADPTARIGDLATALSVADPASDGGRPPADITLSPTTAGAGARMLGRDTPLARSGLRSGAVIDLVRAGHRAAVGPDGPAPEDQVSGGRVPDGGEPGDGTAVAVNRSPRVVPRFDIRTLKAPTPPRRRPPQPFPFLLMVAPLLLGGLMFSLTRSPYSLVFIAMMPLMVTAGVLNRRYQDRRATRRQSAEFAQALDSLERRVAGAQEIERAVRLVETPSTADAVDCIGRRSPLLWTHRPEHEAFLSLRLGLGTAPSRLRIDLPGQNDAIPSAWEQLEDAVEAYRTLAGAPVAASLRETGNIGVAGRGPVAAGVARGLVIQLAALHSPAEVALAVVASARSRAGWRWATWLPHTASPHSPLEGDHLADGPASCADLLARVEGILADRVGAAQAVVRGPVAPEAPGRTAPLPEPVVPALVLVVEDDAPVDRARLVRIAEHGPDVGVHVLWCAGEVGALPAACRGYVALDPDSATAGTGHVRLGERSWPVEVETVSTAVATDVARDLAPLVDAGVPIDDDSDLPREVPYPSLVGTALATDPEAVLDAWHRHGASDVGSLRGVVGRDAHGPFHLDLRTQGPHALVGGTTGAGKSEFLQSWVLGMAGAHPPGQVTFLLVDYKGGAAFADCVDLPHTVGLVTDLTPHLVRRALTSLRAEVRHRERLLHTKRAKDLAHLERTGDPDTPPSLVIVVDEFAALATEIPEFVDGVVDIAARGRSLGLHLILATQRPAGVVKDNLRANTNLRIALRMADEPDSRDILGEPSAAHIDPTVPGRAGVRIGPGRVTTFQTGYAGGRSAHVPPTPPVEIRERPFARGAAWEPAPADEPAPTTAGPTDISLMVRAMTRAAERAGIPRPRRPWLPELAPVYDLSRLPGRRTDEDLALAVADVPEAQTQTVVGYHPDTDGNLAVFGSGGSGRSTVLRTLAVAAADATTRGGPIHVYGIDHGSSSLRMLEDLPHVGAVIDAQDEERTIRLLRDLARLVEARSAAFAEVSAGTLGDYRELAQAPATPRILLLVDGLGAFRDTLARPDLASSRTGFSRIVADGRAVGIHVVMTADDQRALSGGLASSVPRRLVLRMGSADDYVASGVPKDVLGPDSPPGRGILDGHEIQVAVHGGDPGTAAQARAITELAAALSRAGVTPARGVARIPDRVALSGLAPASGRRPVIGIAEEDLRPVDVDPRGPFMISGPAGSGRTTAVHTLMTSLRAGPTPPMLVRFSTRATPLAGSPLWDVEASDPAGVAELATQLCTALEAGQVPGGRLALVVEQVSDFAGTRAEKPLDAAIRACVRADQFVVGEGTTASWSQAFTLAQPFRSARRGVLLRPADSDGESLLSTPLGRIRTAHMPPGRGFLIGAGEASRIQVATAEEMGRTRQTVSDQ
jgi:S-DNA-T family DNA segregation ATPase FtsK/SpoIIIE